MLQDLHFCKYFSTRPRFKHAQLFALPPQPYRPSILARVQDNIFFRIDNPLYSRERFIDTFVEELRLFLISGLEDVAKLFADMVLVSIFDEVGVALHILAP